LTLRQTYVQILLANFFARTVNIWNSLPHRHVVDVNTVNLFTRLDGFWMSQDAKYDFTADLTGTGDRS